MTQQKLLDSIAAGRFLLVCSGEDYSSEIVDGPNLLNAILLAIFGSSENELSEVRADYGKDLSDPDNWHIDQQANEWSTEVGETGRIRILRITQ